MNVSELQQWLNEHGATPKLKVDGLGGALTRAAFIQVFINKNAKAITECDLMDLAKELGDNSTKRIKAVSKVESNGSGWFDSGLPKILYERHYFYKFVKETINIVSLGFLSKSDWGGYTIDINKNGINDSWEKLSRAVCINPDGALQSISIGKFQVMGKWYKEIGYAHPIDMLWDASQTEYSHYKMLVGYIKMARLVPAFLSLSTNPKNNIPFARGYNGSSYIKNSYHEKLANAMK
mgnify:CR=1 FL=1